MNNLNQLVKAAFAEIYFDKFYLIKMHNSFLDQIKSYNKSNITEDDGELILKINKGTKLIFPKLSSTVNWINNKKLFINGLKISKYFIS